MNPHDQFFASVQAELDAGRDPLDYPEIVTWLEEHAESLEDFADLRAIGLKLAAHRPALAAVPTAKPNKKFWKIAAALASAAGLLASVWSHIPDFSSAEIAVDQEPSVALAEPPRSEPSTSSRAVLLSVDVSKQRSFTVSDFAPADPQTGAVVLTMTSNVQHTQL